MKTRMINVKKFFAFGRIGRQEDLIEQIPVSEDLQQIKDSVSIRRIGINQLKYGRRRNCRYKPQP